MMGKLFAIIFGIMEYKFQRNGRIININILKRQKKDKILLWQCIKLIVKEKSQINNIIMIPIYKINMDIQ